MNHGVARGQVELARKLEQLPVLADAFGRGDISQRHAVAGTCPAVWQGNTSDVVRTSPALANSRLYVTDGSILYAFALT